MREMKTAKFCCFCGSPAVLESRIGKGRRPARIIPFSKTKEDCKASYARMMRRAIFAPKELKDEAYIEKFRGISYDAAADFSDELSGAIAPYGMEAGKPFTPAFLSGFYADAKDVDSSVYRQDADELVTEDGYARLSHNRTCARYHVKDGRNKDALKNALCPTCTSAELAMLPVWFLSYKKGDRIAYAVVNGQTGKAAADLPVDRKKYVVGSLLLAVPLFFLLNLRFTITPGNALFLAAFLAAVCAVVSCVQTSRIRERELREDDKGYMHAAGRYVRVEEERIFGLSASGIKLLQILAGALIFMFLCRRL